MNQYTALTTKIRAMRGKLLKEEDYREISYMTSEAAVVSYLKRHPGYKDIFADVDESKVYRTQLEGLLNSSIYRDYSKLFHFANLKQREFLLIYGIAYEVTILRKFLRRAFDLSDISEEAGAEYLHFLNEWSYLDFQALSEATTMERFREALKGTIYYRPLSVLERLEQPTLFDYEMALDTAAFTTVWQKKKDLLSKRERETFEQIYGTQYDMLNILFIHRYKKYYQLPQEQIGSLLIPINYRLKAEKIVELIQAADEESFWRVLATTYYARYTKDLRSTRQLEGLYEDLLDRIIHVRAKKDPFSIATIYAYLHDKEEEVELLTKVVEAIHYDRDPLQIQAMIDGKT